MKMKRKSLALLLVQVLVISAAEAAENRVDFRYSPPEWQATICLPDDPHKTLVDRSGELLYHYRQGGRDFGTRVSVSIADDARWIGQQLLSPRVPIVQTRFGAPGIEVLQEAFAVTDLPATSAKEPPQLIRMDGQLVQRDWARPAEGLDPSLAHIALHYAGTIHYRIHTAPHDARRVALVLCEGWWNETGRRVQVLQVEGSDPAEVDTVADLGKNKAGAFWFDANDADGDGAIDIRIEAADKARDKNTILNGLWVFHPDAQADSEALLTGKLTPHSLASMADATPGGPSRNDMILVHVTNTSDEAKTIRPTLVVDTALTWEDRLDNQKLVIQNHETLTSSKKMFDVETVDKTRRMVRLEEITVSPNQTASFFVLYSAGGPIVIEPKTMDQAIACRNRAVAYWQRAPLPWDRVQLPDARMQALIDAAIRNIWQAREIKNGLPAFQVGPTCYRGLWIVDGAFLLEAATIVGAGDQARNGVAYELTYQQADGSIKVMNNYSKENGIVLWTCVRHAQLTQDRAWLESIWPKLVRIAEHIKHLRQETLANDTPLDDGLVPPGFPDGGIGGVHAEYTNPYWNLLGLHAFIQAARWLGHVDEAAHWQEQYDQFMAAFRKASSRDMKTDPLGNRYLPIRMDGQDLPQRGQWGFCHAVYPGQIFAKEDPLVAGNMAMLAATEREGMVYGTGWDPTGIWNYFASFYGHALLWQGDGRKAAQVLYAFANHAAPVLDWREEQSLRGAPYKKVGDMPHNWASAEFIRLAVHLLALDRGHELHLFEGLPREWTKRGMVTKLSGIATPFGNLTMELTVAADGKTARFRVEPLSDTSCKKIILHKFGWASGDRSAVLELDPRVRNVCIIPLELPQEIDASR